MKSIGVVRKVDALGRIVLPISLRKEFKIVEDTAVEIFVEGDLVMLKKYVPKCSICGESGELKEYKGKKICKKCIIYIADLNEK
jgi:transcriptional pleiotropic regulator of transition state genes